MISSIFVNLPIRELSRSVEFFSALGFKFNAQFTGDDSTCMVVGENIYVMLLEHAKYAGFIDKPIADGSSNEVLISLQCDSSDEVRSLVEIALEQGARRYKEPDDLGFMFGWGFEDLDGHIWELFWMNPQYVE